MSAELSPADLANMRSGGNLHREKGTPLSPAYQGFMQVGDDLDRIRDVIARWRPLGGLNSNEALREIINITEGK